MLHAAALCALAPLALQDAAPADRPAFPPATALEVGVDPAALARLDALVQGFVDDGEVVGAELLVVVGGRSVHHAGYGWSDREGEVPLEPGAVFCVRSMTKPVIGTAARMLVEERALRLDDRVAEFLPSFDAASTRAITVEQLLRHSSGLPMSLLLAADLDALGSVRAVADLGGGHALLFEPGSAIEYSDQGTDTLTAVVEVATGAPADEFVAERLLDPLGMRDSACTLAADDPLRARAVSRYVGSPGAWTRYWSPADPPLFPFFLGSQSMVSTAEDYARFLTLWLDRGRGPDGRLLKLRSTREQLEPTPLPFGSGAGTGFPGLTPDYACLMQVWTRADEDGEPEVVVFGHNGSDGTYAWAFPERDAVVLYFTQSRGTPTGLRVEEVLAELLLGAAFDPNTLAPPFDDYLGYYWEGEGDLYRAVVRDGDDLALEILGKAAVPLAFAGEDRWKFRDNPGVVLAFDRDAEGRVTGYHIDEHRELRFEPSADLPDAGELAGRVAAAHRVDRLETLGALRSRGTLEFRQLGFEGTFESVVAWPDRARVESTARGQSDAMVQRDGRLWIDSSLTEGRFVEGAQRDALLRESLFVRFGDWREHYPALRTIQRLSSPGGDEVLLVRAGDLSAPAPTYYVHAETGRLVRESSLTHVESLGRVGQNVEFGDYREVEGMWLPFQSEVELAYALVGTIVSTTVELEVGAPVTDETFAFE